MTYPSDTLFPSDTTVFPSDGSVTPPPVTSARSGWYLGPSSALVQIPAPKTDLDVSPILIGGVHRSVGGGVTVSVVAQPRQWPLQWTALTEDQATYLRLAGLGLLRAPLRLIDGEIRNRLPMRISVGGSYTRTAVDFTQTGGVAPTWVPLADPPASVAVRGAISWQRTTTTSGTLVTANVTDRVPLVPGQQVQVSCWARGAAVNASVGLDQWDVTGAFDTRASGTTTTLAATTWTQLTATVTPVAGAVEGSPIVIVLSGEAASTLQVTGWQLAPASSTTPITWAVGGGAPIVAPGSALVDTYILTGLRGFGITLLEANP